MGKGETGMSNSPITRGFKQMLAEANAAIETISVQDLPYFLEDTDVVLVDVRLIEPNPFQPRRDFDEEKLKHSVAGLFLPLPLQNNLLSLVTS